MADVAVLSSKPAFTFSSIQNRVCPGTILLQRNVLPFSVLVQAVLTFILVSVLI